MTWSYSDADLSSSTKDAIRAEIGDVNSGATITLSDAEIVYLASQERNFWASAARCAEVLARRYLAKADVRLGRSLMVQYTTQAQQFQEMAVRLRHKAQGTNVPWVGGMSSSDKQNYAENDTLVQPIFARDMQENPWVGGYTSDSPDEESGGDGDGDGD